MIIAYGGKASSVDDDGRQFSEVVAQDAAGKRHFIASATGPAPAFFTACATVCNCETRYDAVAIFPGSKSDTGAGLIAIYDRRCDDIRIQGVRAAYRYGLAEEVYVLDVSAGRDDHSVAVHSGIDPGLDGRLIGGDMDLGAERRAGHHE